MPVGIAIALSACSEGSDTQFTPIRSVKTIMVGELAGNQQRQFAGVLMAARVADLSFAVPGTVQDVLVERGMTVSAGQVLAHLNPKTYDLAIAAAQARLSSARAELKERELNFDRQKALIEKQLISRAALDKASAELGSARAQRDEASSNLEKTRRDREHTAVAAPYSGMIAMRNIEPYQEVAAGQTVFSLEGGDDLLVEVLVPESLIREVGYGKAVQIRFPTLPGLTVPGAITEIGSRIESGSAFPARARIDRSNIPKDAELRPGLSARVALNLDDNDPSEVNLIPLSAVALGQDDSGPTDLERSPSNDRGLTSAPVFLFDQQAEKVHKVMVLIGDIRGNLVEVHDGLAAGDRVVVAGVPFLRDGMSVRLWSPEI